nr:hypothetical protein I308_06365 [Cryptococcus tetragattii IND107]
MTTWSVCTTPRRLPEPRKSSPTLFKKNCKKATTLVRPRKRLRQG